MREYKNSFLVHALLLSVIAVSASFLWQGDKLFNLWDEGFLWYGVQRVMLGEVPIRDFMSYDPGRYYWSGLLMSLFKDNGIMALRMSVAVFQMMGLFVGLLLVGQALGERSKENVVYFVLSSMVFVLWMYPRHKLFDCSLSIFLIGILALLAGHPTRKRYFFAGMGVGLIAFFGRNHGVYGVVGSLGVILWLNIKKQEGVGFVQGGLTWALGVIAGYVPPMLLLVLIAPEFFSAFLEGLKTYFHTESTNINLPIPWLWRVDIASVPIHTAIHQVLVGLFFIAEAAFAIVALLWAIFNKYRGRKIPSVLVAASFLSLPYMHFSYSRADIGHLAQGVFPLLVGTLSFFATQSKWVKWPLVLILCGASLGVMLVMQPGWICRAENKQCIRVDVAGEPLYVYPHVARNISLLQELNRKYTPNDQNFLVVPFWPGAYALLERKCPMWEIYSLRPRSDAFQDKEIERIKAASPQFVVVLDFPLDGRDDFRFKNLRPRIYQYILSSFDPLNVSLDPHLNIFRAPDVNRGQ